MTQYLSNDSNEFHNLIADRSNNPANIKNNTLSGANIVHNKKMEASYQYMEHPRAFNKNITDQYKAA